MIKNKKIFITGGAGFIATRLIYELIQDNQITTYDNFHRDTISSTDLINHDNLNIIEGDVLDYEKLVESMNNTDIVIHAAGIAGIDTVIQKPTKTMMVNMVGTANALKAAHANQVPDRFIDFSTSEVFGSMSFKSSENDNTVAGSAGEARWTYAVSKLAGEHLSHAYYREFNLPTVSVRPFNVYGPGQTGEGALMIFIQKAVKDETIHIDGDGSQIRAWCFVDDFVNCLLKCIESPKAIGESFNIGNSRSVVTILGLAEKIIRVLNSNSKIVFDPPLSADVALRIPNVDKAKKLLDFEATTQLSEGIIKTAEYIVEMDNA